MQCARLRRVEVSVVRAVENTASQVLQWVRVQGDVDTMNRSINNWRNGGQMFAISLPHAKRLGEVGRAEQSPGGGTCTVIEDCSRIHDSRRPSPGPSLRSARPLPASPGGVVKHDSHLSSAPYCSRSTTASRFDSASKTARMGIVNPEMTWLVISPDDIFSFSLYSPSVTSA